MRFRKKKRCCGLEQRPIDLNGFLRKKKTTEQLYFAFCGRSLETIEDKICSEFSISEKSYGIATSLYGKCSHKRNAHVFTINCPQISWRTTSSFHGNSQGKLFSINYQLAAAMQQMGCGNTDAATPAGFLDLPPTWSVLRRHLWSVEKVMGPIQVQLSDESKKEALSDEIECARKKCDLKYHKCKVEGHEHPPLPTVKGSYDMGWPTKGTSRNYNSHTGFGCFVGAYTHKILMSRIFCRWCRICEIAKTTNTPPRQHDCIQNWPTDPS